MHVSRSSSFHLSWALVALTACDPDDSVTRRDPPGDGARCERSSPIARPAEPLGSAEIQAIRGAIDANLGTGFATGYSVAVWRDGEVVYSEGFGARNQAGDPVTPATVFQIGS